MKLSPIAFTRTHQRRWAAGRSIPLDVQGYTLELDRNLLQPLSPASRVDFTNGDGAELGIHGRRGKMQALHSSSALACNVFDYWRDDGRDRSALAGALGIEPQIASMKFEQKFDTGIGPRSPNLDVVLYLEDGSIVAIESKFLECYSRRSPYLAEKYFPAQGKDLWEVYGLRGCQELANTIRVAQSRYKWLHVEQLLKHILGLAQTTVGGHGKWQLLYLWYQIPSAATEEHQREIEAFGLALKSDGITFRAMTYQKLYSELRNTATRQHEKYLGYLGDRYF